MAIPLAQWQRYHRLLNLIDTAAMPHPSNPLRYTARLCLRQPCESDIDVLFRIFGDPATNAFNPAGPYQSRADAEATVAKHLAHWARHGFGDWAISLRSAPEAVIGFGGLGYSPKFAAQEKANLGYRFATEVWGQGLATELAQAAARFAFEDLALDEIWATVRENHMASRRVLEKIGLTQVNRVPDPRGVPASIHYRILRSEYQLAVPMA